MSFLFKMSSYKELDDIAIVIDPNPDDCIICYDNTINKYGDQLKTLYDKNNLLCECSCNVFIHESCLKDWLNVSQSCPVCRRDIKVKPSLCKKHCKCDICRELRHCIAISCMLLIFYILIHWKHEQ